MAATRTFVYISRGFAGVLSFAMVRRVHERALLAIQAFGYNSYIKLFFVYSRMKELNYAVKVQ